VAQRKPGAFVVFRFEARDAKGEPATTSDFGALYRGVSVEGGDRQIEDVADASASSGALATIGELHVPANAAHVYTECARVWNPIHTDIAYAKAAGLPTIILHGTATLALSVSRLLNTFQIAPSAVRRVQCRFTGMVLTYVPGGCRASLTRAMPLLGGAKIRPASYFRFCHKTKIAETPY